MTLFKLAFTFFFSITFIAPSALALPSDSRQIIEYLAKTNEFDYKEGTITLRGEVVMTQGSMVIKADTLIIYGKLDRPGKVVAIGKPAKFSQIPTENAEPVTAQANRLEYQVENERLYLIENAVLDQDGASLSGGKIEYDVKEALVKAGSTNSKKNQDERVRMVIPPKALSTEEK